jgi:hypothetical protein
MSKKKQRLQDSIGDIDSVDANDDASLEEVEKRDPNNPLTMQEAFDKMYIRGDERRGANAKKGKQSAAEVFAQLRGKKSLAIRDVSDIQVGAFRVTSVGLQVQDEQSTLDDWNIMGELLFRLEGSIQWLIGDWLVHGLDLKYGDITSIAEHFGRAPATLHNYMSVVRAFEFSLRSENLSYGHHQLLTTFDDEWRQYFIQWAEENNASIAQLRSHIQQKQLELEPQEKQLHHVETPFDKSRLPNVSPNSSKLQRWWAESRLGNEDAKKKLRDAIYQYRKWLDNLEDSGLE